MYKNLSRTTTYKYLLLTVDVWFAQVFKALGELSDSLSSWEVGLKGLDNQTSFHILDLMSWLEVEDWESLHSAISLGTSYRQETIQSVFYT